MSDEEHGMTDDELGQEMLRKAMQAARIAEMESIEFPREEPILDGIPSWRSVSGRDGDDDQAS